MGLDEPSTVTAFKGHFDFESFSLWNLRLHSVFTPQWPTDVAKSSLMSLMCPWHLLSVSDLCRECFYGGSAAVNTPKPQTVVHVRTVSRSSCFTCDLGVPRFHSSVHRFVNQHNNIRSRRHVISLCTTHWADMAVVDNCSNNCSETCRFRSSDRESDVFPYPVGKCTIG